MTEINHSLRRWARYHAQSASVALRDRDLLVADLNIRLADVYARLANIGSEAALSSTCFDELFPIDPQN